MSIASQERKIREIRERYRALEHRQQRVDPTLVGTVKEFLNGWKVTFNANGAYYLVDTFGNSEHLCSYSKRHRMFDFLKTNDLALNYSETSLEMGTFLFVFTKKLNYWTEYK
jgi:hypothetical protein